MAVVLIVGTDKGGMLLRAMRAAAPVSVFTPSPRTSTPCTLPKILCVEAFRI